MKKASIILSILAACLCCACRQGESKVPAIETEVTIRGLEEGKWVYFSIKDGETVGTSTFLSEEEDKAWAERTDWGLRYLLRLHQDQQRNIRTRKRGHP